jgi:hypothetical protein
MKARVVWGVASGCTIAVLVACAVWIRDNPRPAYYDEALYAIYALIDAWALKTYGFSGAYYAMLKVDPLQPPALRILALPFTIAASPSLAVLRAISLGGLLASAAMIAVAVKRVAGDVAAAFAFLFTMSLPIIILSTRMFHTEYALLLAVALLLLGLTSPRTGLLIALSVAIGLLSKASYPFIAAPALLAAAYLMPERRRAIAIGGAIGVLLSSPWWIENFRSAIGLVNMAGTNVRHAHEFYAYVLVRCGFGYGIAAAIAMCLARKRLPRFAWICLAGGVPLILLQAFATGHNPRHVAIPIALIAIAAAIATPELSPRAQAAVLTLAAAQIIVMVAPIPRNDSGSYIFRGVAEVMAPVPEWNWAPLRQLAAQRGFPRPRIAMLGEGYAFNAPQIRYAWPDLRGEVPVETLYEWTERKPFDVHAAVERSSLAQLAITAVGFDGEESDGQVPNNRYNAAYAAALAHDPRFEGPYVIDVGVRRPARIQVFVRR